MILVVSLSSFIMATRPTSSEVVAVAVASCAAHELSSWVPATVITRIAKRCGARRADGFDLRCWLHSLLMGCTARGLAVWEQYQLDVIEPERSYRCLPPATALAWVLPAIEVGYALHDLRDAARIRSVSFAMHGVLVGGFLAIAFVLGIAHHLTVSASERKGSIRGAHPTTRTRPSAGGHVHPPEFCLLQPTPRGLWTLC